MRTALRIVCALSLSLACGDGAEPVTDQAGFADVPARADAAWDARMFWVFRAADAPGAPLAVLFNGGPGWATSFGLLAYGTAPVAIDVGTRTLEPNPASWTSFANLLYVDERQSGFSYGLSSAPPGSCVFDPRADAADFVRALLGFLDGHPALRDRPVVFVGESYGGMRAVYALDLLLRYQTEAPKVDGSLAGEIQAHYDRVFPDRAGTPIDEATAATQFGRLVLLEPFLLGRAQIDAQAATIGADPYVGTVDTTKDPYDVREPVGFTDGLRDSVATALAGGGAPQLFAEDPAAIPGMAPADRALAFRTAPTLPDSAAVTALEGSLVGSLGPLAPADAYVHALATACADVSAPFTSPTGALDELVAVAPDVRIFLTRARFDASVYTPALLAALSQAGHDDVATAMHLATYDDSGHMIEVSQPAALHDDVAAWLSSP
jgi:hypothetical protein